MAAILLQQPRVAGIVVMGIHEAHLTEMVVGCTLSFGLIKAVNLELEKEERLLSDEILRLYCRERNLIGYCSFQSPATVMLKTLSETHKFRHTAT